MRVLVGCECSGVVSAAFRALGHESYSCDIQPYYGASEYGRMHHIQRDIKEVYDYIKPDLFICHPPCTYLCRAGAVHLFDKLGRIKDDSRYRLGVLAAQFFEWCFSRPAPMICIENPIPIKRYGLPKPTQIIQPYFFGEPYSKATCLWLRGLPPLQQTNLVKPLKSWVVAHRSQRLRSQTFDGVALAMADAWGRGEMEGLQYTFGL